MNFFNTTSRMLTPQLSAACMMALVLLLPQTATSQESGDKAKAEEKTHVDPSGTWKWEREFGDNVLRSTLILKKVDSDKLTGTLQTIFGDGGGPGNNDPVKIDDGKINGESLSFSVTRSFNNNEFTINYTGKYVDGKLGGTYELDFGNGPREFEWNAKRFVGNDDVVGKWQLKFQSPNGDPIESSMTIEEKDKKLAGTYHSGFFGDAPMSKMELKEGTLSFTVVFQNDNGEFEIAYSGKPQGNAMKGTITAEFGDQKNETPFEATLEKPKAKSDPVAPSDADEDKDGDSES